MSRFGPTRFVRDEGALTEALRGIKLASCPHCRRNETLIGHGFLRGHAERSSGQEIRGRRFFCSNRARRRGCGQTFSVTLMTVLRGFVVRTLTLLRFAQGVLGGQTQRAAWLAEAGGSFSLSSGYRLWRRLGAAQSSLRAQLAREVQAPECGARHPLAELLGHLGAVVREGASDGDHFAAFQEHTQRGLFDA